MRALRTVLLASIAAVALTGGAGSALAKDSAVHTMTVQLPDGGTAHIHYTGNVPPAVMFTAGPAVNEIPVAQVPVAQVPVAQIPVASFPDPASLFFGPSAPFAPLQQISAAMDQQMLAMMHAANAMMPPLAGPSAMPTWSPNGVLDAGLPAIPPGAAHISVISTMSSNGNACTRTMEITRTNGNQRPQVVSHTSGNCDAAGSATFGNVPAPAPHTFSGNTLEVNAQPDQHLAALPMMEAENGFVR